jgi:geranylgeranyl diphosphate synthase type II
LSSLPDSLPEFAEARRQIDEALDRYCDFGTRGRHARRAASELGEIGSVSSGFGPADPSAARNALSSEEFGDCPARLREAIRYSLLAPGKRLRPMLVLMAAKACGCDPSRLMSVAAPAACAVEMIHAYSLIHDDLPAMDDDDLRRGRPTSHKAFDEATAILAGDALLTRAFEIVAEGIHPPEAAARCCRELAKAAGACHLVGGQADDLSAERTEKAGRSEKNGALNAGDYERLISIHRRKTGAMIEVSLRLGGIVAGAGEAQLAALSTYGRDMGLAFQIIDDLLDYAGDEKSLGKRARKDSARGKLTFPAVLGAEASGAKARELIAAARAALKTEQLAASELDSLAQYVLERNH